MSDKRKKYEESKKKIEKGKKDIKKTQKNVKSKQKQVQKGKEKVEKLGMPKWAKITIAIVILLVILGVLFYLYYANRDKVDYFGDEITGSELLNIHLIDVGQGDGILIELPNGEVMIIDGGSTKKQKTSSGKKAKDAYIEYIDKNIKSKNGVKTIDHMMLTHTDSDHIAFLKSVIDDYDVKNFYIPKFEAVYDTPDKDKPKPGQVPTQGYKYFLDAVDAEQKSIASNVFYNIDAYPIVFATTEVSMMNYCLSENYYKNAKYSAAENMNAVSPISVLDYGEKRVVLTGDATGTSEQNFLDKFPAVDTKPANILKIAHHGSNTEGSSGMDFFKRLQPEYALISVGEFEEHKHPDSEVLKRLNTYKGVTGVKRTLTTRNEGNMVVTIDELGNLGIKTQRKTSPMNSIAGKSMEVAIPQNNRELLVA